MVWMKNRVISCDYSSSHRGEEVICHLEMDPAFALRLESRQVLRRRSSSKRSDPFNMWIEITRTSPESEVSSGVLRVDQTSRGLTTPDAPLLRIICEMSSDDFLKIIDELRSGNTPSAVLVEFQVYFNSANNRGRQNAVAIHKFDSMKELLWKNLSTSDEHPVEAIVIQFENDD